MRFRKKKSALFSVTELSSGYTTHRVYIDGNAKKFEIDVVISDDSAGDNGRTTLTFFKKGKADKVVLNGTLYEVSDYCKNSNPFDVDGIILGRTFDITLFNPADGNYTALLGYVREVHIK